MKARFTFNDAAADGSESADQHDFLRLARMVRSEAFKRIADIGCMNPDEIIDLLKACDQLIDLHISASLHDDKIESFRQKLQQVWSD